MATSVPSISQRPSCPVCYRDYSDSDSVLVPRILHCGHTYCTECLQRLLAADSERRDELDSLVSALFGQRGGGLLPRMYPRDPHPPLPPHEVTCPVCKSSNHIQDGDVGNLTKNFALLGFRDSDTKQTSRHYCKDHEHEQRVYCQDCRLLICAYCQLYGRHKNHSCAIASEACQPAVEEVRAVQAMVHGELEQLQAGEAAVLSRVKKLERGQSRCEKDVARYFDRLIDMLQQKRESEVTRARSWANEQAFVLHAQLHSLTEARKNCDRLLEECKTMTELDPLRSLTEKDSLVRRAEALSRSVAGLSLEPIISPRISSHQVHSRAGAVELVRELVEGVQIDMSLEDEDEGGSEEEDGEGDEEGEGGEKDSESLATSDSSVGGREVRIKSLHAQDTHHNEEPTRLDFANGLPKLDPAAFPLEPHPPSAAYPSQVSTPASYTTHTHRRSSASQLHYPSSQHSPASTNSDNDSGEEYKVLALRQPLPFLMSSGARCGYSAHRYRMSHDEADHADDEAEEGEEQRVPSVASSSAHYSWPEEQDGGQSVSLSVGGQEVHISIVGSAWPPIPMNTYPRLMDRTPPQLAGDPFLDLEGDDPLVEDSD